MKENTEQLLQYLLERVKNGIEFSKDQMPDVVNQMLVYDAWKYGAWLAYPAYLFVGGVLLLLFGALFHYIKKDDDHPILNIMIIPGGLAIAIAFFLGAFKSVDAYFKLKQIQTAPKYYLIEKLMKGK